MKILGISGQMGSGKDTVADYLVDEHNFVKVSLSDPIKRGAKIMFGFTDDQLWGPSQYRNEIDARFGAKDSWYEVERKVHRVGLDWVCGLLDRPAEDVHAIRAHYELMKWLYDSIYEERISPRVILQTMGTEWGRARVSSDIWIMALINTIGRLREQPAHRRYSAPIGVIHRSVGDNYEGIVVPDVRFENEMTAIRYAGGSLMRVKRRETDGFSVFTGVPRHASETEQQGISDSDFKFVVQNESSLEDLYEAADRCVEVL